MNLMIELKAETVEAITKGNAKLAAIIHQNHQGLWFLKPSTATAATLAAVSEDFNVAARNVIWKGAEAHPKKTGTKPAKAPVSGNKAQTRAEKKLDAERAAKKKPTKAPRAPKATKAPKTSPKPQAAKSGTKATPSGAGDAILAVITRPQGGTLQEAMDASGWQAHSARAYINARIPARGYTVTRQKVDGVSVYKAAPVQVEEAV